MIEEISKERLEELLELAGSKRARILIRHIAEHGFITTEEIEQLYGYRHPPRAARDVRDAGIPLITFYIESSEGRRIGAYRFGDLDQIQRGRAGGRSNFSKRFEEELYEAFMYRCAVCAGEFTSRQLQVDHRIPYAIAGDAKRSTENLADYMPLCASCNRSKSWSCEHCPNWEQRSVAVCEECYWAHPESHTHIATRELRRADIVWQEDEVAEYDILRKQAEEARRSLPNHVKELLRRILRKMGALLF